MEFLHSVLIWLLPRLACLIIPSSHPIHLLVDFVPKNALAPGLGSVDQMFTEVLSKALLSKALQQTGR